MSVDLLKDLREALIKSGLVNEHGKSVNVRTDHPRFDLIKKQIMESPLLSEHETLKSKIYAVITGKISRPKCETCNVNLKFNEQIRTYPTFCSLKCKGKSKDVSSKISKSLKNSQQVILGRIKSKKTNLEKYGNENPFGSQSIKEKIAQTNLARYGNTCPLGKTSSVRVNSSMLYGSEKFKQLMVGRYGNEHYAKTEEGRLKIKTNRMFKHNSSLLERRLQAILIDQDIIPNFQLSEFTSIYDDLSWKHNKCGGIFNTNLDNGRIPVCPFCYGKRSKDEQSLRKELLKLNANVIFNDRKIIAPLEIDVIFIDQKFGIELNGPYWHQAGSSTPLIIKTMLAKNSGFDLMHIWTFEWWEKQEKIMSIINHRLNRSLKIYARNCTIRELDSITTKKFLIENHLQGHAPGAIFNLGLIYEDMIIGVMTVGKSRYSKEADYELLRFCSKLNISIIGGFSKLLSAIEPKLSGGKLITYADRRFFNGSSYIKSGFIFSHASKPGHIFFHKKIGTLSRQAAWNLPRVLGDKYDQNLSQAENLIANGFVKLIDCGQLVFIKEIS